jgi:hypothetical protein
MPILRQWTFKVNPNRQLPNLRETFSIHARVWMRVLVSTLIPQSNENKSCMHEIEVRVEKREFAWEFSPPVKREQELHESWWELRSESLHESFLNSRAPVKRKQELHESWWELRSENLHESFLNSHVPVKREQELHESWWELRSENLHESTRTRVAWELRSESLHESFLDSHAPVKREQELMRVEKREFTREFFQLSCPRGQTRTRVAWELMRVDWILQRDSENCYQLALKFEPVQSWWKSIRVGRSNASEGCNFHPRLTGAYNRQLPNLGET